MREFLLKTKLIKRKNVRSFRLQLVKYVIPSSKLKLSYFSNITFEINLIKIAHFGLIEDSFVLVKWEKRQQYSMKLGPESPNLQLK
jgi:hypothetical protein